MFSRMKSSHRRSVLAIRFHRQPLRVWGAGECPAARSRCAREYVGPWPYQYSCASMFCSVPHRCEQRWLLKKGRIIFIGHISHTWSATTLNVALDHGGNGQGGCESAKYYCVEYFWANSHAGRWVLEARREERRVNMRMFLSMCIV